MNSLLEPDIENYKRHFGWYAEFPAWQKAVTVKKRIEVEVKTLDNYFKDDDGRIDYLKLDTQGNELDILKGASDLLGQGRISLIKVEVMTVPVYKDQAFFSDIDIFLRAFNYTLIDFITYGDQKFSATGRIRPEHSAPCGDAIYIKDGERSDAVKIVQSMLLFWLGYPGLAKAVSRDLLRPSELKMLGRIQSLKFRQRIKNIIKGVTPPLLLQVLKKIRLKVKLN